MIGTEEGMRQAVRNAQDYNGKGNGHTAPWERSPPWEHPLEPLRFLDYSTLPDTSSEGREWLIENWFPMYETIGFGGPGGEGKTLLAHQLATCAPLGRNWLDKPVRQMKAALVLCEDRDKDAFLRQIDINRHYGCTMADLHERLLTLPRRNNEYNYLAIFDRDDDMHLTQFFYQLLDKLKDFGAQLVVLDTRSDVFRGNQNNEHHARMFVRKVCDRIAWELQGLTFLLFQPSIYGRGDGTSGSVQWDAAFRGRSYLKTPAAEAGEEADLNLRQLSLLKSNFSAKGENLDIIWHKGVFVRDVPEEQPAYEHAAKKSAAERIWHEHFAFFAKVKRPLSPNEASPNYAPKLIAKRNRQEKGAAKCSERDFHNLMEDLINRGVYRLEERGSPSRPSVSLVRVE